MSWEAAFAALLAACSVTLGINVAYLARSRRRLAQVRELRAALPPVSVIVPARNEAANLQALLPSLLAQTYPDVEILVYDDASDDATWEVLAAHADRRLRALRGGGPPAGWVGKVHALWRASREAAGDVLVFLDADVRLRHPRALEDLVRRYLALPPEAVLSGMTRLRGGGSVIVSMVPFVMLAFLPMPLIPRLRWPQVSAMNGQCWVVSRATYARLEPHRRHPDEVLEDIRIGRFLMRHGVIPYLEDLQEEVEVWMYANHRDAWRGFRKNAYLFMGGSPAAFAVGYAWYLGTFLVAPVLVPVLLVWWYLLKGVADRHVGVPWWVTVLTPVTFVAWGALQLDSAVSHWRRRVGWKGRQVARSRAA